MTLSMTVLIAIMLSVTSFYRYAGCHAECRYAECRSAQFHYVECRGANERDSCCIVVIRKKVHSIFKRGFYQNILLLPNLT